VNVNLGDNPCIRMLEMVVIIKLEVWVMESKMKDIEGMLRMLENNCACLVDNGLIVSAVSVIRAYVNEDLSRDEAAEELLDCIKGRY